jgi:hypothetical protein
VVAEGIGRVVVRSGLREVSAWAVALLVYATPVVWYALREPASGHVVLFAVGALALVLLAGPAGRPGPVWDVAFGLAAGVLLVVLERAIGGAVTVRAVVLESLFSSRQGFFFWTPLAWAGLFGLVPLARSHAALARRAAVVAGVLMLASAFSTPWWSGHFGNGRLVGALPLLAPGLAAALEWVRRRARVAPAGLLAVAAGLVVAWNLLFMQQYRRELIPRDDTVAFPVVAENAARLVSEGVGSPVAWPANWLVAARHGIGVARFDRLYGLSLRDFPGAQRGTIDIGRMDTDAALLGDGWSVRHACEEEICRDVEGRAEVFVPLDEAARQELRIRAAGQGSLSVQLDGEPVGRPLILYATLREFTLPLGPAPLARGPHTLVLQVSPSGRATVDRLALRRTR